MAVQRSDALPRGYTLDRYQIESILGEGGFGITYLASHIPMGQKVAIKEYLPMEFAVREKNTTVAPRSTKTEETYRWGLERFLQEAKVLAQFSDHPNIVSVRDFFEANGTAYLVMEYLEGQTFGQWLIRNPQPSQDQLLQLMIPVLDGLRAIHAKQYLHRDIKPGNVFIRSDGRPVLIDFGSARQAMGEYSRSLSVVLSEGYAPNEQYSRNGKQGPWTDVYAVGACLWRAVSGHEPPPAPDRSAARDNEEPDPLVSALEIGKGHYSEKLLQAIDWSLTYLPKSRPQSVNEFQELLLQEWQYNNHPSQQTALAPAPENFPITKDKVEPIFNTSPPLPSHSKIFDIEPELVFITSGKFIMGCLEGEKSALIGRGMLRDNTEGGCYGDEKPAHEINISSFFLGKYPITFTEFDYFCESVGVAKPDDEGWGRGKRPVINISWHDAQTYVRWLCTQTNRHYRLPTEAEWEYAARGGSNTAYPWGNLVDLRYTNCGGKMGKTTHVDQYPDNSFGLHDMHGNVWEWCQDWYAHDYYLFSPANNPKGPEMGTERVLRGGSWNFHPRGVRSAARDRSLPDRKLSSIGFRIALDPQ
ncbi:MAG: SUMF1/EgtB/PvdO family nonheme iron enzyme [Gammaproteobacteria bacterium]|nr:SUMF1/EgtB/PvdO family nonheme iron enzyme [Gammaproteobacteria bacterium]MBU1723641.1 SUMF1/EgtB/PvdO family nonheme iron enzyme [Gammaproteobacteria bacterium]MBU2005637.1 SUMF1/EgtB/PvdO family nonheme iron enzyme [Gammaproteobacteria bacterium]